MNLALNIALVLCCCTIIVVLAQKQKLAGSAFGSEASHFNTRQGCKPQTTSKADEFLNISRRVAIACVLSNFLDQPMLKKRHHKQLLIK